MDINQNPVVESGMTTMEAFFKTTPPIEEEKAPVTMEEIFKPESKEKEEIEEVKPVEEIKIPAAQTSNSELLDLVKEYIEEGDWEDVILDIEGEEVQLSQIDKIDKKTFLAIRAEQKRLQEEKHKEKYISVEGLDETTKTLVELKRKGGDIYELLKTTQQFENPVEGLDLDDEATQVNLVYGKLQSQGMEHEDIIDKLTKLKKQFKLDEVAKGVAEDVTKAYEAAKREELNKHSQELVKKAEEEKAFKKNLQEVYKGYNLNDNKVKTLVENAFKRDSQGKTNFDKLVEEVKSNPEKLAEINFFLNDREGFMEFKTAKAKNETALKTIKIISTVEKKSKTAQIENEDENPKDKWTKMFSQQ